MSGRGRFVLEDAAAALRAELEVRQDAPGFKRFALRRADELLIVDLVFDRVPQVHGTKSVIDGVLVDPLEEIAINKLTTVVSRMEERDLVDLYVLERTGLPVEGSLAGALAKDGGCTPATLAWLLSEIHIPDDAKLPGGVPASELRAWLDDVVVRLRRAAAPPAT